MLTELRDLQLELKQQRMLKECGGNRRSGPVRSSPTRGAVWGGFGAPKENRRSGEGAVDQLDADMAPLMWGSAR